MKVEVLLQNFDPGDYRGPGNPLFSDGNACNNFHPNIT